MKRFKVMVIGRYRIYTIILIFFFICKVCEAKLILPPELNAQRIVVNDKKVYLTIKNKSEKPWLIQSWVEDLDEEKKSKLIFPEFFRVEAFSSFNVTIFPLDFKDDNVEKMHWLTVRMIPEINDEDAINFVIPVNYRLKIFHRSETLSKKEKEYNDLEWNVTKNNFSIKNKSGFYYSFSELSFSNFKVTPPAKDVLPPYGEVVFDIPANAGRLLSYTFIDDFGNEQKILME